MHYCFPKIYFLNIRDTVDNHFAIKKVPPCPFEEMFREMATFSNPIFFTFSHNFEVMLTKNVTFNDGSNVNNNFFSTDGLWKHAFRENFAKLS